MKYPNLFKPMRVNGLRFRNRIFAAPTQIRQKDYHGSMNDYGIAYYEAKARGGAAMVCVGDTPVEPLYGASQFNSFYLSDPGSLTALSETAAAIKQYGAVASLELSHGGMMADPAFNGGRDPIGPMDMVKPDGTHVRGMDAELIDYIVKSFAKGAVILKKCGFDMCTIHAGHSTLIQQFLSPRTNRRTDEYGGSLENRMRLAVEIVDAVRAAAGKNFPIELRISGDEFAQGGFTQEEMIQLCKVMESKVDLIHVSAGVQTAPTGLVRLFSSNQMPHGCNVYLAEAIKQAVSIPVVTVGSISYPQQAEDIIAQGKADFVAMARALIADPEFPNKAKRGETPRPCMRCLNCLFGMNVNRHLTCTVNPTVGSEHRFQEPPVGESRRVLVIGGGPGGLTAAATAAERGHRVVLCEASDKLGGHMAHADVDPRKADLKAVKDYMLERLEKSGAEVRLNTPVDGAYIDEMAPDAVICAVGSVSAIPPIPGIDGGNVITGVQAHDEGAVKGDKVVIIGGGLVGCETALYLTDQGKSVTVIEMLDNMAQEDAPLHRMALMMNLGKAGVNQAAGHACTRITAEGVYARDKKSGEEVFFPADTVVVSAGMRARSALADELESHCDDFYPIGDCQRARKITDAVREGYFAALYL